MPLDSAARTTAPADVIAALLLLFQAVQGPPAPSPRRTPGRPCSAAAADGEIVVCGRPEESQRLARLPEDQAPADDPMSFRLPGGGKGRLRAIQSSVGGFTGQGAAVTLTIPLGQGRKR